MKNQTPPMNVDKWYLIEPLITKISIFGKVEVTFSIPLKLISNLT
jgi:hypothetical protein